MDERHLELATGFPLWVLLIVGALFLALSAYQFLSLRRSLHGPRALILTVLRLGAYLVVLVFFLTPTFVRKTTLQLPLRLAVLVDDSGSMGLPHRSGTRLESVKHSLLPLIEEWKRKYQIELYRFDEAPRPLTMEELKTLKPEGKQTRLIESLNQVTEKNPQGVILLSDGITQEEDFSREYRPKVPIAAVGMGEGLFRDNGIKEVKAPAFGFRESPVRVDLTFVSEGYPGREFPVYLYRGRNVLATKTVRASEKDPAQNVSFSFTPKEIGTYHLSIETPVLKDETIQGNNQKALTVEVLREKIRVLTLSGAPSWDYRFLRLALKRDPMIDLVSFVFLRTPTDSAGAPESQLSLIPFPIDTIFQEELKNFDLVIFDDFGYRPYFNWTYLEKVRDFVKEGGGLAMIGGGRSFDDGGYANTPLAEVLPVQLTGRNEHDTRNKARAMITEAGKHHPITRPLSDRGSESLDQLPPLESVNRIERVLFGETLIAIGADAQRQPGRSLPLLVVGKTGKGRVAALMTGDLWRWNFQSLGTGGSNQIHLRLVSQLVRWLVKEPALEQVQIVEISKPSRLTDRAEARVRVLKEDYSAAPEASVQAHLQGPDGLRIETAVEPSGGGEFAIRFFPNHEGAFRLQVEARAGGKSLGKVEKSFLIQPEDLESQAGKANDEFLKSIAAKSDGEFILLSQMTRQAFDGFFRKIQDRTSSKVVEEKELKLWSTLPSLLCLLLLLSVEWGLRRRWGLL